MESFRSAAYWIGDFDVKSPEKSHPAVAFFYGGLDGLLALPEFVELLMSSSDFRSQVINALKNLSWQQIQEQLAETVGDLAGANAYKQGRASVDVILTLTGIVGIARSFGRILTKTGVKAATKGTEKAAAPAKAVSPQAVNVVLKSAPTNAVTNVSNGAKASPKKATPKTKPEAATKTANANPAKPTVQEFSGKQIDSVMST